MRKIIALLAIGIALILGCAAPANSNPEAPAAENACISACQRAAQSNQDLSAGPCLLDPVPGTDWVCDVAHAPREPVDNDPKNQCAAFKEGRASHFVEVNSVCNLIREA